MSFDVPRAEAAPSSGNYAPEVSGGSTVQTVEKNAFDTTAAAPDLFYHRPVKAYAEGGLVGDLTQSANRAPDVDPFAIGNEKRTPAAPSGERYDVPQTPSNTVDAPAPKTPSSPASGGLVSFDDEDDNTPENVPAFSPVVYPAPAPQAPTGAAAQPISIPVEIGLNPQFVIQGTAGMSQDEIIATVKSRIREMVDDISDELAERLARVFANMPA